MLLQNYPMDKYVAVVANQMEGATQAWINQVLQDDTLVGPFGTLCGGQRSCQLLFALCWLFWLRSGTFDSTITITLTFT